VSGTQYDFNPQLYKTGESGPAWRANHLAAIAGDITVNPPCRAIYVGGAGDISVTMAGGRFETSQALQGPTDAQVNDTTIFKNVPAGTRLPIMVSQIKQSGTTATDLILLY
jgi:hypothetical protein